MLISVILTTFKRPALLVRSACSVLAQSLPTGVEMELVISDDDPHGSSLSCFGELQKKLPSAVTIKIIKRGNDLSGVAASRNRALAHALGEWIAFLDDDDVLQDGALQALLGHAQQSNADFCAGGFFVVQEDKQGEVLSQSRHAVAWHGFDALLVGNMFPIGSFVARRTVITHPFNTSLVSHEDWLFLIDNLRHARVATLDHPVLQVRQATDASREHRNIIGGATQKANDYARIYALHPAPHLLAQRKAVLASLGGTDIDALIGGSSSPAILRYHETNQGRFLICNPQETIQSALLCQGQFEPLAARIAAAIVALRPGAIVDVGANIGAFTVPIALALPECLVLAVEPQRMVFMHLCANILGNKLLNVRPLNIAVGRSAEVSGIIDVPFFNVFAERYTGSVSLDRHVQLTRGAIHGVAEPSQWAETHDTVSLRPLDALVNGLNVAFVKVDVEGMEEEVLASGEILLRSQRPSLFFEAWSLAQFSAQRQSLFRFVLSIGYTVLQIGEDCFAYHPEMLSATDVTRALGTLGLRLES